MLIRSLEDKYKIVIFKYHALVTFFSDIFQQQYHTGSKKKKKKTCYLHAVGLNFLKARSWPMFCDLAQD